MNHYVPQSFHESKNVVGIIIFAALGIYIYIMLII